MHKDIVRERQIGYYIKSKRERELINNMKLEREKEKYRKRGRENLYQTKTFKLIKLVKYIWIN